MGKSQFENLGEDIMNSVAEAIDTGDFSNLSRNVEDLVNVTFDKVGGAVRNGINQAKAQSTYERQKKAGEQYYKEWQNNQRQGWQQAANNQYTYGNGNIAPQQNSTAHLNRGEYVNPAARQPQLPVLYKKNLPGKVAGPVLTVCGGIGTGLFAVGTIGFLIGAIKLHALFIPAGIFAAFTCGFIGMTGKGSSINKRNHRFKEYLKCIGNKSYCKIEDMASHIGKSSKYVKKDIRRMMAKGYFLQGHLDNNETMLITSNEVYEHYTAAETSRIKREEEEKKRAQTPVSEVDKLVREGQRYIDHIHECNDAIPGEEISAKLQRLEDIMIRIFDQLKRSPESAGDLRKMMNYYLPTTTKLIDTYRDLDARPELGDNIKKTKQEIEDTLDTINNAFEKIFDDMFLNTAWDISSDISVMKTMLAQEGLTEPK